MPHYKNETVTDAFLQGMVEAYRAGVKEAGAERAEGGDASIIERLESQSVEQLGAAALGLLDGGAVEPSVADAVDAAASVSDDDEPATATAGDAEPQG